MSHPVNGEHKENELVHFHGPKPTAPHGGHEGTSFEGVDASVRMVIWSLLIIVGTLVVTMIITIPIQKTLRDATPVGNLPSPLAPSRVVPQGPLLEVHPWDTLPQLREHENEVLNGYGKDAEGHVHIPIDRAMDAVVSHLTIRPDAPSGLTTPGGLGRDFAGSINNMPPPYQRPQIQGEIRKNAQQ
jgi:hypothetical protein